MLKKISHLDWTFGKNCTNISIVWDALNSVISRQHENNTPTILAIKQFLIAFMPNPLLLSLSCSHSHSFCLPLFDLLEYVALTLAKRQQNKDMHIKKNLNKLTVLCRSVEICQTAKAPKRFVFIQHTHIHVLTSMSGVHN